MRNYVRKSTRCNWDTDAMCNAILDVIQKRHNVSAAARFYRLPIQTLRRKLYAVREKDVSNITAMCSKGYGMHKLVFTDERLLVQYFTDMERKLISYTNVEARKIAFQLAERCKPNHPFNKKKGLAGEDWWHSFLKRNKEEMSKWKSGKGKPRVQGFNKEAVREFFSVLQEMMKEYKFPASRIYTVHEMSVTVAVKTRSTIIDAEKKRQVEHSGSARGVEVVSAEICFSASGVYTPMMLIFPRESANEILLRDAPPGTWTEYHSSGCIQSKVFLNWMKKFIEFSGSSKDCPVLLILDELAQYVKNIDCLDLARENGVLIISLPPKTTHKMQPIEVSFKKSVSNYYNSEIIQWSHENSSKVTIYQIASLLGKAFLKAATADTAINGFYKTGIYPLNPDIFTEEDFDSSEHQAYHESDNYQQEEEEEEDEEEEVSEDVEDAQSSVPRKTQLDQKQKVCCNSHENQELRLDKQTPEIREKEPAEVEIDIVDYAFKLATAGSPIQTATPTIHKAITSKKSTLTMQLESQTNEVVTISNALQLSEGQLYLFKNNKLVPVELKMVAKDNTINNTIC